MFHVREYWQFFWGQADFIYWKPFFPEVSVFLLCSVGSLLSVSTTIYNF